MNERLVSRIIGFFDLVLSSIGTTIVLVSLTLILVEGPDLILSDSVKSSISKEVLNAAVWVGMVVACIVGFLQMYAAWKLIEGTHKGISPTDGLRFCRTWKNITTFFIVMQIVNIIRTIAGIGSVLQAIPSVISISLHVLAVILVMKYANVLKSKTNREGSQTA